MERTLIQKMDHLKVLCQAQTGTDPVAIAVRLMGDPNIGIHGPEHHMLDGAALLTALHNAGADFPLEEALDALRERAVKMPGATCGQWGVCGAAASVGAALSVLHGTGPLSDSEYYKDNLRLTSRVLGRMAELGGPRCCKRNAFLALTTAAAFVEERYGIAPDCSAPACGFYPRNAQCIGVRCPFHPDAGGLPTVAFVCVHNSCRSQMAEALGKYLAAGVFTSCSAGTETRPQIDRDAVRIMKSRYGIDMEQTQRSKLLSELPPVDIVVTMGCNVNCPNVPCRHREDWGLDDPSGKTDGDFLRTAALIEEKIKDLSRRIQAGEI